MKQINIKFKNLEKTRPQENTPIICLCIDQQNNIEDVQLRYPSWEYEYVTTHENSGEKKHNIWWAYLPDEQMKDFFSAHFEDFRYQKIQTLRRIRQEVHETFCPTQNCCSSFSDNDHQTTLCESIEKELNNVINRTD